MSKSSDWARNLQPIEPGPEHHVITDLAARLAKAERERDEAKAEIERMTPRHVAYDYLESPARREMAEARVSELERALEEAEKVIKPFAEVARVISDKSGVPEREISDNILVSMRLGEFRAARKWMEERHD